MRLGEAFVPDGALTVTDPQISFALAAAPALRAGVQSVQVIHQVRMGEPEPGVPHTGVESNVAAFVLHPTITVPAAVTVASKKIAIGFAPPVGKAQRVTLFLHEFNAPEGRPARAFSFPAPKDNGIAGPATETAALDVCVRRRGRGRLPGLRAGGWRRESAGVGRRGQVRHAQGDDHMNVQTGWLALNQRYLMVEVARVRRALEQTAGLAADPSEPAPEPSMLDFADSAAAALVRLAAAFGLSSFERDVLLLCAATEFDGGIAPLCARAAGDLNRPYPTFGLALAALADPHWSALAPVAPLRRWRLIELVNAGFEPLATTRLRIDERVLHHLTGLDYLDERLAAMAKIVMSTDVPAPEQAELVAALGARLGRTAAASAIQLSGDDRRGKRSVAAAACHAIGGSLYELAADDLPANAQEREILARLWEREAALSGAVLLVETHDSEAAARATAFAGEFGSPLIIAGREPLHIASAGERPVRCEPAPLAEPPGHPRRQSTYRRRQPHGRVGAAHRAIGDLG